METQAIPEKVGKAKGEKKCSQFMMLCRCYSKYCNALEGVDGGETHLPPPLWRVGGKKVCWEVEVCAKKINLQDGRCVELRFSIFICVH